MQLRSSFTILLLIALSSLPCAMTARAQEQRQGDLSNDPSNYDKIVDDFIQFDIGRIRDPRVVERIKARFNGLRSDDAVPALVRGMNKSTRMRASCPITAISGKLRSIVNASKDPEVGSYVLRNLERANVGQYTSHLNAVFDTAEKQVTRTMGQGLAADRFQRRAQEDQQRLAYVPGMKLSDLALRDSAKRPVDDSDKLRTSNAKGKEPQSKGTGPDASEDLSKLNAEQLTERIQERPAEVLAEFSRRASAGDDKLVISQTEAIVKYVSQGEEAVREAAARVLGQVRSQAAVPSLIDAIDDPSPRVRSAAVTALTRTTRQLFGPSDDATPAERHTAQDRWREWWAKQGKNADR